MIAAMLEFRSALADLFHAIAESIEPDPIDVTQFDGPRTGRIKVMVCMECARRSDAAIVPTIPGRYEVVDYPCAEHAA